MKIRWKINLINEKNRDKDKDRDNNNHKNNLDHNNIKDNQIIKNSQNNKHIIKENISNPKYPHLFGKIVGLYSFL